MQAVPVRSDDRRKGCPTHGEAKNSWRSLVAAARHNARPHAGRRASPRCCYTGDLPGPGLRSWKHGAGVGVEGTHSVRTRTRSHFAQHPLRSARRCASPTGGWGRRGCRSPTRSADERQNVRHVDGSVGVDLQHGPAAGHRFCDVVLPELFTGADSVEVPGVAAAGPVLIPGVRDSPGRTGRTPLRDGQVGG